VTCGHDVAGILRHFLEKRLQRTMALESSKGRRREMLLERSHRPETLGHRPKNSERHRQPNRPVANREFRSR
jgi:hypothetical protein